MRTSEPSPEIPAPTRRRSSSQRSAGVHVAGFVGARIVAAAVSACIGFVVPRVLGVAESADYGVAVGIAMMLVVLTDIGCTTSLARYLADGAVTSHLLWRVIAIRYAIAAAGGAVLTSVGLLAHAHVLSIGRMDPALLMLAGLLVVSSSLPAMAAGLLPTLRRVRALLAITILQPVMELAGIGLVIAGGATGPRIVAASMIAGLGAGVIGMAAVIAAVRSRDALRHAAPPSQPESAPLATVRTVMAYGRPMFLVAMSFTLFGQIDQLVIYALKGPNAAAPYIWNWRLITLLHMPALAAASIIAPRVSGADRVACRSLFLGWLRLVGVAYVGIVGVAVAVAPWLVPLALGRDKYGDSWTVFVALAVYAGLLGIAPLVTMAANFLGGARRRVQLGFVTIAVNAVLDLVLVPRFGVYGAAFGTTVAFAWYVAAHLRLTLQLLSDDTMGVSRSWMRAVRTSGPAICVVGSVVVIAMGVAHFIASWEDIGRIGVTGDLISTCAGGITGFLIFAAGSWWGLRWLGIDLRDDMRRDTPPVQVTAVEMSVERGAA